VYTRGQRHGFTIFTESEKSVPHYVTDRDVQNNTITVSPTKPQSPVHADVILHSTNLIQYKPIEGDSIGVVTRYRQVPTKAKVISYKENELRLQLEENAEVSSAGQSCVLYCEDQCLGGGIIL
jgi:tRNA-specific 2-thiouridylase